MMSRLIHARVALPILLSALGSCSSNPAAPSEPEALVIDFSIGTQGWTAGFADYPVGQEDFFELESDYRVLSPPLDTSTRALYISGNNHSDDLFMFYKGQLRGLRPNTRYRAALAVQIATSVPNGCVGVGGSPGESVTVKAGATNVEPEAVVVDGNYRMNIDKGNQTNGGEDALVLGDVANSVACGQMPRWELKDLSSGSATLEVTTDGQGALWLFAATDSGFEATTSLYYTRFVVTLEVI